MTENRTHGQTFWALLVACHFAMMAFFFVVRAFGGLWFQVDAPPVIFPRYVGYALLIGVWLFDAVIILKILTGRKWRVLIRVAAGLSLTRLAATFFVPQISYMSMLVDMLIDITIIFLVPFIFAQGKRRKAFSFRRYFLQESLFIFG